MAISIVMTVMAMRTVRSAEPLGPASAATIIIAVMMLCAEILVAEMERSLQMKLAKSKGNFSIAQLMTLRVMMSQATMSRTK